MNQFRIQDIVESTGAVLERGNLRGLVNGISTDTRSITPGQLFVALTGPNYDGDRFAADALARGAAGVLMSADGARLSAEHGNFPDALVLRHRSPRNALSELARWHRARLAAPVIGITGSCGKTTTKTILVELLSAARSTVGSPASFNNDIGVPHTLFLADQNTQVVVVEMGTNAPGEIAALCRIANPSAGIVTNVGASHLAGLGSVPGVAAEKSALVQALPPDGFCVLNADCQWTRTMRRLSAARVITFSVEGGLDGEADLTATDVWFHPGGTTFRLDGREITMPLLGLHNVHNLLAALAACRGMGIPLDEVLPAVSQLKAARRRMERHKLAGITLIDDSYNANPESARASVRVLAGLHGHARRVLVLGDMLELGEFAAELHKQIGEEAAKSGIDVLVLVGDLTRATAAGALEAGFPASHLHHLESTDEALHAISGIVRDGDVVLIKGSRRTGLDRLVTHLVESRREDAA